MIARGPYGIRTWFYNRRGTGGWERYLPDGYPAFPGASTASGTPDTGQQAAFNALNALALQWGAITSGKIRDVWTGENKPDPTTPPFSTILPNLAGPSVGNCPSAGVTNLAPPTYASCIPPTGTTGFTAAEWTAVVNQMLREAYFAQQVVGHFGDLETIRQSVFESESGSMPAIATDLQLAGAAGNTTQFDLQSFFGGLTGIAASIAGLVPVGGPELSAGLWVASEVLSMLPSASTTANSSFQTTYDGLLDKVATARDEMDQALKSQSQQVRGDQALLELVGKLRSRGTWKLNVNGMESASRQAFVLATYQALMPTVYDRYRVSNCANNGVGRYCRGPSLGAGVIGSSQSFTTIGLPPTTNLGLPVDPLHLPRERRYLLLPLREERPAGQCHEPNLGAGVIDMQLPAREREHRVDVRVFAGNPGCREHRRLAWLGLHDAHRPPRDHEREQCRRRRSRQSRSGPRACRARRLDRARATRRLRRACPARDARSAPVHRSPVPGA